MVLIEKCNDMNKLGETYKYVFLGVLSAMFGSWAMYPFAESLNGLIFLMLFILEIFAIIAFCILKKEWVYYVFTTLTGLTLVPMLHHVISNGSGDVIIQAFSMTTIITGGLTMYAKSTKKDFLSYGTILFWLLVALLVVGIINIFLASSIVSLMFSFGAAVLFSFFMIYDTQQVLHTDITPLEGAMNLYLDILNLFTNLLNIGDMLDD